MMKSEADVLSEVSLGARGVSDGRAGDPRGGGEARVMAVSPLEDPLFDGFYKPHRRPGRPRSLPQARPKPTHYKIVCISLYTDDIERLEAMVQELKKRGHTKANKSQLIRAALDQVDLNKVPKGY